MYIHVCYSLFWLAEKSRKPVDEKGQKGVHKFPKNFVGDNKKKLDLIYYCYETEKIKSWLLFFLLVEVQQYQSKGALHVSWIRMALLGKGGV